MRNGQAIRLAVTLDSGMKASEAIERARLWWDTKGRHLGAMIGSKDPIMKLHSGICSGQMFDWLNQREAVQVVKIWHHVMVRRPDLLDIAPDAPFKLGGKETVN